MWALFATIVKERKERESDPTTRMLEQLVASAEFAHESADAQDRMPETLRFMNALGSWSDEMLRLSPTTLEKRSDDGRQHPEIRAG